MPRMGWHKVSTRTLQQNFALTPKGSIAQHRTTRLSLHSTTMYHKLFGKLLWKSCLLIRSLGLWVEHLPQSRVMRGTQSNSKQLNSPQQGNVKRIGRVSILRYLEDFWGILGVGGMPCIAMIFHFWHLLTKLVDVGHRGIKARHFCILRVAFSHDLMFRAAGSPNESDLNVGAESDVGSMMNDDEEYGYGSKLGTPIIGWWILNYTNICGPLGLPFWPTSIWRWMVGSQVQYSSILSYSFNPAIPPNHHPNHLPAPFRPKFFGCLQTLSLSWPPHGKGIESPKLSSSEKNEITSYNIYKTQRQTLQLLYNYVGKWIYMDLLCSGSTAPGWLHRPSCAVPPFLRGGSLCDAIGCVGCCLCWMYCRRF